MRWKKNKPKSSARSYALWLLGRQAYAAAKMRERLVRRGYSEEEADDATAYLLEIGYLNDVAFAENFVAARSQAGYGPRKLRWELQQRGLDNDTIESAVDMVTETTLLTQMESLLQRRLRNKDLDDPKVIAGAYRYLLQRGYDYALVEEAMQKVRGYLDSDVQNS